MQLKFKQIVEVYIWWVTPAKKCKLNMDVGYRRLRLSPKYIYTRIIVYIS